jgi:hypothetical protein
MNGTQCGCPALRRRRLCFFHVRCQDQRQRILDDQFKQNSFVVPVLEDANAVQLALMQVMQMLANGQMDHKTAGLMLYALQTASGNLRNVKLEPWPTDVVIDRDDVHRTAIQGPQWFKEDFEDEEEEEDDENAAEAEDDEPEEVAATPVAAQQDATDPAVALSAAKPPVKLRANVSVAEAREKVRGLINDWVLDTVEPKARQVLTTGEAPSP